MRLAETLEAFAALLAQVPRNHAARLRIARRMLTAGFTDEAREVAETALDNPRIDPETAALARKLLSACVPRWHFRLVRDADRNRAYDATLARAVRPGSRVLEIGAGTGLLAMMAARAGATDVISCEANAAVAAAATQIVESNGLADRIRIVAKHSDDLVLGEDLPGPADILVSEIISNNLFGEGALPAIASARARLLSPDAQVIPAAAAARIALAEGPEPGWMRADTGFDLSAFNRFHPVVKMLDAGAALQLRSAPGDLFTVDFQQLVHARPERAECVLESHGGRVNGVAQWLHLQMDAVGSYENRPGTAPESCWAVMFHYLPEPIETRIGERVTVGGAHDLQTLDLWVVRD